MPRTNLPKLTASLIHDEFGDQPITTAQALNLGLTRHQISGAIKAGTVASSRRGVIASVSPARSPDLRAEHLDRLRNILCAVPNSCASSESAAIVLGLPYPKDKRLWDGLTVRIAVPGGIHKAGNGFQSVAAAIPAAHRTLVDGIPATTPARTAVELARWYPMRDALITMDAAMRNALLGAWAPADVRSTHTDERMAVVDTARVARIRKQFAQTVDCMRSWPGVRNARRAIALANPAAESPLESISRGSMVDAELPMPEVGALVVGDDGRIYYSDFLWREQKLIGEADGWSKYQIGGQAEAKFREEKLREDALRAAGFRIVRWTWSDVVPNPTRMVARIKAALIQAAQTSQS